MFIGELFALRYPSRDDRLPPEESSAAIQFYVHVLVVARPGKWDKRVGKILAAHGFDFYIAKDVQSIFEINSEIIRELKNSDFYLFVNFRREAVCVGQYRGSLFSHQEFAIAYALGFERILVVNQRGVKREGVLGYFGCNTEEFDSYKDCLAVVK